MLFVMYQCLGPKNNFSNNLCMYREVNSSSPGQNGSHFTEDIFKQIFFSEKIWFLTKISLEFVPKGSIDNNTAVD